MTFKSARHPRLQLPKPVATVFQPRKKDYHVIESFEAVNFLDTKDVIYLLDSPCLNGLRSPLFIPKIQTRYALLELRAMLVPAPGSSRALLRHAYVFQASKFRRR